MFAVRQWRLVPAAVLLVLCASDGVSETSAAHAPAHAVTIALTSLSAEAAQQRVEQATAAIGGALRLGFGRQIPAEQLPAPDALPWRLTADGRPVLRLHVRAPGARGLRVALRPRGLPDAAELRFSGAVGALALEEPKILAGALINASLAADAADGSAEPLFWSPLIAGDALQLDLKLPAGTDPQQVRLGLPAVSHIARLPGEAPADAALSQPGGTDPACHADWDSQSRATTLLLYSLPDGGTGACTGTLVADADPDTEIPYILTAQHCFPGQARASSIDSRWLVRAETCGGPVGTGKSVPGGADILYSEQSTDTALLRLRQPPPIGVAFARIKPELPSIGAQTTGIHHPRAAPQRLSTARVSDYKTCIEVDWCGDDADPTAIGYVKVDRNTGGTSPGSSGSALFDARGYVVGTNLGGSDAEQFDYYGRIDTAYHNALQHWLGTAPGRPSAVGAWERLNQTFVTLYRTGQFTKALRVAQRAVALAERPTLGPAELAASLNNQAAASLQLGDKHGALRAMQRALQLREQQAGVDSRELAQNLVNIAQIELALERPEDALPHAERALALQREVLPAHHPEIATTQTALAGIHAARGDTGAVQRYLEAAYAIRVDVLGREHPLTVESRESLSALYRALGWDGVAEGLGRGR